MRAHHDLAAIAELATSAPTLEAYEREILGLVERRVGFDVAFFKRAASVGPTMPGFDPRVRAAVARRWAGYGRETEALRVFARGQRGVVVDAAYFGPGLERLAYYQDVMRPHRGRSTALLFARRRGELVATIIVGRCTTEWKARELDYLRAIGPTLALSEATLPVATPPTLTAREREVLGYLHLGYTNAEIAAAVGSAARTVRNQLSSAYAKLGVANRAEAVGLLRRRSP